MPNYMAVDFRKHVRIHKVPNFGPFKNEFHVWVIGDKGKACAEPLVMKPMNEGERLPEPTFKIEGDEVQWLMDELWNAGVRPSQEGTAGQLDATKYHLEDMRKIANEMIEIVVDKLEQ